MFCTKQAETCLSNGYRVWHSVCVSEFIEELNQCSYKMCTPAQQQSHYTSLLISKLVARWSKLRPFPLFSPLPKRKGCDWLNLSDFGLMAVKKVWGFSSHSQAAGLRAVKSPADPVTSISQRGVRGERARRGDETQELYRFIAIQPETCSDSQSKSSYIDCS